MSAESSSNNENIRNSDKRSGRGRVVEYQYGMSQEPRSGPMLDEPGSEWQGDLEDVDGSSQALEQPLLHRPSRYAPGEGSYTGTQASTNQFLRFPDPDPPDVPYDYGSDNGHYSITDASTVPFSSFADPDPSNVSLNYGTYYRSFQYTPPQPWPSASAVPSYSGKKSSARYQPHSISEHYSVQPEASQQYSDEFSTGPQAQDWEQEQAQEQNESRSDYMSIGNPEGYFKVGRVFKTDMPVLQDETLVVIGKGSDSVISCVPGRQPDGGECFPIIRENPTVYIEPSLQLDFDRPYVVEPKSRILNIGRVDRNYLKTLKARSQEGTRGDRYPAKNSGVIPGKARVRTISTDDPKTKIDPLHKEYRVHDSSEFRNGRVFKVFWSEPYGDDTIEEKIPSQGTDELPISSTRYGEQVYSTIRRFVIVKTQIGHSACVPILTYGKRGTSKPGVKAEYHTIIYTSSKPPSELEGEQKLFRKPIRVVLDNSWERLRPESRVNYSKFYTVEHNVKVCFIGEIHPDSEATFFEDFRRIFNRDEKVSIG